MANVSSPAGLVPVRYASGAPYNGACRRYYVPSTDGTALYVGDPVIVAGSADTDGVPTCTRATAGSAGRVTGAVVGVQNTPSLTTRYRAASVSQYVFVADDPNLLYEIEEDAVGGALAAVDVGLNADLASGSGSTVTGLSGFVLDTSTKATTATLQLRIVSFVQRADNIIGANAKVLVRINLPTETGAAGSTGI
ncbi:MAG: hypothetical protein JWR80_9485 [Bradyrhizobium sp.]|nr:hypothetical protein [Bradyrhizobium sp.]